ncbi:MAG: SsrA-binding protein SmpB [Holosporales bacterium]
MAKQDDTQYKVIAENRRARYDYSIEESIEAGIVLTGSEVKSMRLGRANIAESHAAEKDGEFYLFNANINEYASAAHFGHYARRPRKLLLKKKQVNRLIGAVTRKGMTVVPLVMYFNHRGMVKVQLGLAKGKKLADKRASEKERDWKRQKERILKERG